MSRGDLTEAEWFILKDLLPIEPENRGRGRRPSRTVRSSTAFSGDCDVARHGVTYLPDTVAGTPPICGFDVRAKLGSGRRSQLRWQRSWRTAAMTGSTAPQFAPTSRQRAEPQAGEAKRRNHRRALGRSPGGSTSKLHYLADAFGRPFAFHLTVGEAAHCKAYDRALYKQRD